MAKHLRKLMYTGKFLALGELKLYLIIPGDVEANQLKTDAKGKGNGTPTMWSVLMEP